jgi:hypothetical protein
MGNRYLLEDLQIGEDLRVLATYIGPGWTKIQGKEYIVSEDLLDYPLDSYVMDLKDDGETPIKAFQIMNVNELESKEKWTFGKMIMDLKRLV